MDPFEEKIMNRRLFLKVAGALIAALTIPLSKLTAEEHVRPISVNTFAGGETTGPEEIASFITPRIRLLEPVEIYNYSRGGPPSLAREFDEGEVITKEELDSIEGYTFNPGAPGFFEVLIETGAAELVT